MMKSPALRKAVPFASTQWACFGALFIVGIAFMLYVGTEKRIDRAHEPRYELHALVAELRQSSDDLTRMARSYVATGDTRHRKNYQEIIDIRDGNLPRPQQYEGVRRGGARPVRRDGARHRIRVEELRP